jgi:iron complex transport system ATP-binding protein
MDAWRRGPMNEPVLRLSDVTWASRSATVLDGVSLDLEAGELVAVMGRNGAGKSTLLDIAAGLRLPARGSVQLQGRPLHQWMAVERARVLAHLPQGLRADLTMRAEDLVLMGRYPRAVRWLDTDEDRAAARDAMQRCGCLPLAGRALATLSGGERQRVYLAACLAQGVRVLLMDEPATFLDIDQQLECFALLRAEADRGAACLAVTHDANLALSFCTRVIVVAEGHVACDLPIDAARATPDWLRAFSHRLELDSAPGRTWVRYR